MHKIRANPDVVKRVWLWCRDAFAQAGYRISFPKNTNPQKTYQWRYAARLAQKLDEWELDEETSKAFIEIMVEYIAERGLLRKGLSAFFQTNALQVCYDRLDNYCSRKARRIESLQESKKFIDAKSRNRPIQRLLLDRPRLDANANIVAWFESNDISMVFLAVSRSCTAALSKLAEVAPEQRDLLPTSADLFCVRSDLMKDKWSREQAKKILGPDWRQLCPR